MEYLFYHARKFNQPIGNWDVSKVTNMNYMFRYAYEFAQDLTSWPETSTTTTTSGTYYMFGDSSAFHARFSCPNGHYGPPVKCTDKYSSTYSLSDTNFFNSVYYCLLESPVDGNCVSYGTMQTKFGVLSDWDVSKVTNMSHAFKNQLHFDGDLSK